MAQTLTCERSRDGEVGVDSMRRVPQQGHGQGRGQHELGPGRKNHPLLVGHPEEPLLSPVRQIRIVELVEGVEIELIFALITIVHFPGFTDR